MTLKLALICLSFGLTFSEPPSQANGPDWGRGMAYLSGGLMAYALLIKPRKATHGG